MKVFLTIICFLSVTNIFGQDTDMLGYINQYRKQFGKTSLVLSNDLTKVSVEQTNKIISDDSLSHSHKTSEIATMGKHLPSTVETKLEFFVFVESVMGIKYEEPKNEEEVVKYVKLYCLYMFDKSPKHKNILLGDYKNIGFETVIKNITFKSNEVVINGQVIKYKNIKSHYMVDFYCVINFN